MTMATYVDAQAAAKVWINSWTADLVGPGNPLAGGAHLHRRAHGARATSYAWLSLIGGGVWGGVENPDYRARISAAIYGHTNEAACAAALAYAEKLGTMWGKSATVTLPSGGSATILLIDNVTGPIERMDVDEPRFIVDADWYLRP